MILQEPQLLDLLVLVSNIIPYMVKSVEFYHPLTHNLSQLNSEMCGPYHRTGQLCGHCDKRYKLPAYYHGYECVMCDNTKYNWLKYMTVAFAPLTFFLFVVFCFRISATSAQLNAFILFSQNSDSTSRYATHVPC